MKICTQDRQSTGGKLLTNDFRTEEWSILSDLKGSCWKNLQVSLFADLNGSEQTLEPKQAHRHQNSAIEKPICRSISVSTQSYAFEHTGPELRTDCSYRSCDKAMFQNITSWLTSENNVYICVAPGGGSNFQHLSALSLAPQMATHLLEPWFGLLDDYWRRCLNMLDLKNRFGR